MIYRPVAVTLLIACLAACANTGDHTSPAIAGDWSGSLDTGAGTLRLVFHINEHESGYSTTIDSLDQGATGIPTGDTTLQGDTLLVTVPVIGGTYRGTVGGDVISGTWSQSGMSLPLNLQKADK